MIDATHRNTALLVAGCFFMEMLDGTIVITAAPQIGRSLGAPPAAIGTRWPRGSRREARLAG